MGAWLGWDDVLANTQASHRPSNVGVLPLSLSLPQAKPPKLGTSKDAMTDFEEPQISRRIAVVA